VCGSDLHQYHGRVAGLDPGIVMGHEFMGVVEEIGPAVRQIKRGDRVLAPFSISCGACEWCRMRLPTQCSTTGRAVFGGRFGKQYPGGQAEVIRVPFADHMCEPVPAGMADEQVFFLGDILSTGYVCAENAGIRPGDTVAVFGAGPVGLLALQSAHLFGPSRVFVVDRVDYRLKLAEELGGIPVNLERGDPAEQLRALTRGRGPDAVLECVGHETPFTQAIQAVRAGGTVSSVGVFVEQSMASSARGVVRPHAPDGDPRAELHHAARAVRRAPAAHAHHHTHDATGGRAEGVRDLRPQGGSRDQGDAQALSLAHRLLS
jgi:glutathione-independent formaldehyde dehydrogenase